MSFVLLDYALTSIHIFIQENISFLQCSCLCCCFDVRLVRLYLKRGGKDLYLCSPSLQLGLWSVLSLMWYFHVDISCPRTFWHSTLPCLISVGGPVSSKGRKCKGSFLSLSQTTLSWRLCFVAGFKIGRREFCSDILHI